MRCYSIFLKIAEYGDDAEVQKQFKKAKKTFLAALEKQIEEKTIIIAEEQKTPLAVDLSIEEKEIEAMIDLLRAMETVDIIDTEHP
jgi:hypothetical protein